MFVNNQQVFQACGVQFHADFRFSSQLLIRILQNAVLLMFQRNTSF